MDNDAQMIKSIDVCRQECENLINKIYESFTKYTEGYSGDEEALTIYNLEIDYNKYLYAYNIGKKAKSIIKILEQYRNYKNYKAIEIDYLTIEELLRSLIEMTGIFFECTENHLKGRNKDFMLKEVINELYEDENIINNLISSYKDPSHTNIQKYYDTENLKRKVIGLVNGIGYLYNCFPELFKDCDEELFKEISKLDESNWEEKYKIVKQKIHKIIDANHSNPNFTNRVQKGLKKIEVYYNPSGNPVEMFLDEREGLEKTPYPSINMMYKEFSMATHINCRKLEEKTNIIQRFWSYWSILMLCLRNVNNAMGLLPPAK